jgi:hypothetical protein
MKRALVTLLCLSMFAAGCARETTQNSAADTGTAPALFYPPGILPPGDSANERRDGVYSSDTAAQCCFLAGSSSLTLDNPPGAQLAVFKFYVPSVKPLLAGTERVRVAFDGLQAGAPARLSPGAHDVIFTIPASLRQKRHLVASIVMSVKWVPKEIGLNADERELSVMLLRVGYI